MYRSIERLTSIRHESLRPGPSDFVTRDVSGSIVVANLRVTFPCTILAAFSIQLAKVATFRTQKREIGGPA